MTPNFDSRLMDSTMLWLDNKVVVEGGAYQNKGALLYQQVDTARGQITYASPYKGWVYDSCATGASIPSGVYTSSGQFLTRASGITFDFNNGRVLSSGNWGPTLSGNFARKEYNVYYSNDEDTEFYLESLYKANKDLSYAPTGVGPYQFAAPCIIVTKAHAENTDYAFGGVVNSDRTIRLYTISNNNYNQDVLGGLLTDTAKSYYPLVQNSDMPLSFYGDLKTGYYSYCDIKNRLGCRDVLVNRAYEYKLSNRANKSIYFTVMVHELDVQVVRQART